MTDNGSPARRFRSSDWLNDAHRRDQTALYLERYMNYGITPDELRSGRPAAGIAQGGSEPSPRRRAPRAAPPAPGGAGSGAVHELRDHARRAALGQARSRDRPERQRSVAVQPAPPGA